MSQQPAQATYFDGVVTRRRSVTLRFDTALDIIENDTVIARWPYGDIRRIDHSNEGERYGCLSAASTARLEISGPEAIARIEQACLQLDTGASKRALPKIIFWSVCAAASLVMLALFGMPWLAERITPLIPASVESKLGDALDGQVRGLFGGKTCNSPAGRAALDILTGELSRQTGLRMPLKVEVISSPIPNAVALPGGRIYIFQGLLTRADDLDGFAGVIGHEMGHIAHRDGLRQLVRAGGTSFLLGLLFGDVTGAGAVIFAGRQLLDSAYSRDAETQADRTAADAMLALGRSPAAMGKLLVKLTGEDGQGLPIFFRSHPYSRERASILASLDKGISGKPLLDESQWQALRAICK